MDAKSIILSETLFPSSSRTTSFCRYFPCLQLFPTVPIPDTSRTFHLSSSRKKNAASVVTRRATSTLMLNSASPKNGVYTVGDFMTIKEQLIVVNPSTTVDEALESLVENRITGFPVIDEDWKLVGVVSDYDLLALDTISGTISAETSMFPEVDSSWKVFNELQSLLSKTNGKLVADVMTQVPVVVRETTNLEDAAKLLLETRYRRLPVLDAQGKLAVKSSNFHFVLS